MVLPCRKGMSLQKTWPKIKSRSRAPTSVNGMQNTPSDRSEMAKLSCAEKIRKVIKSAGKYQRQGLTRNKLVTVRMREFCTSVKMTRTLPVMPSRKMTLPLGNKRRTCQWYPIPRSITRSWHCSVNSLTGNDFFLLARDIFWCDFDPNSPPSAQRSDLIGGCFDGMVDSSSFF